MPAFAFPYPRPILSMMRTGEPFPRGSVDPSGAPIAVADIPRGAIVRVMAPIGVAMLAQTRPTGRRGIRGWRAVCGGEPVTYEAVLLDGVWCPVVNG